MTAAQGAVEAVWRLESARIVAGLAGLVRDVGLAEELAQDALVAALEQWPAEGIPANPGAWLMLTAKHRAIDRIRRNERLAGKLSLLARELETAQPEADYDDEKIDDDLLRLMFIACHPVLSTEARIALTLRLLGGLTTEEIARGFLAAEPTIAKRIARAKRTLAASQVPFEVPSPAERPARLASVLEVLYLVFNEGYSAMAGDDWMRPALCTEALRLARVLAELMPNEPEVHGLAALMEIQASRIPARLSADGRPVPLPEQNRGRWDQLLIRRGFTALLRAERAESAEQQNGPPGPYVLQAAIAACHARARTAADTDWPQIALLYQALAALAPSPVVELNRAVAVAMADGPERGLRIVDGLATEPALAGYHHLPSVRGDLLARLGRHDEAAAEFRRAAALTKNFAERAILLQRAAGSEARRTLFRRLAQGPVRPEDRGSDQGLELFLGHPPAGAPGADRGELVERAAQQRPERHGRVGGGPAPDRDLRRGGDGAGQELRVHVALDIDPGSRGDRLGQGLLHLRGDLQVLATDGGRAEHELEPGQPLRVRRLVGPLVVRHHGADQRLPQRLAGRAGQQFRADPPCPVRAEGADRLVLAGEVIAERPQRHVRLSRDVLDGDVLQPPLDRQPDGGRAQRAPHGQLLTLPKPGAPTRDHSSERYPSLPTRQTCLISNNFPAAWPPAGIAPGQSDEPVEQRSGVRHADRRAEQPRAPVRVLGHGGLHERVRRLDEFGLGRVVVPGRGRDVPAMHYDLVDRHPPGHLAGQVHAPGPGHAVPGAFVLPGSGQPGQPVGQAYPPVRSQS
jgi:RNA polymerase sigma factor (sigma-70 family)